MPRSSAPVSTRDGHTSGIALPNQAAQETLVRTVCDRAGVRPGEVDYVEAHGTGTPVGDPIEARSLGRVLSADREGRESCIIGSVKTNIGHLESAAGIAGLIKAALMLKHRKIPPSLHFKEPNPDIAFAELKLRVSTDLEDWPQTEHRATVGVNSFGFGGTNAHVLLTEHRSDQESNGVTEARNGPWVMPISARSEDALEELVKSYAASFKPNGSTAIARVEDICFTASVKRSPLRASAGGGRRKPIGPRRATRCSSQRTTSRRDVGRKVWLQVRHRSWLSSSPDRDRSGGGWGDNS